MSYTFGYQPPRRMFRIGTRVQFIDPPILAKFIPSSVTGRIVAKRGYRAYEIACDGNAAPIVADFPENLRVRSASEPATAYAPVAKFVSKKGSASC